MLKQKSSNATLKGVAKGKSSPLPGASLYDDVDMEVGTAAHPSSSSFSTTAAARDKEVSHEVDVDPAISWT